MKKKIKVGIPKAFLYYRYEILWQEFFYKIDCEIILSSDTTKETITNGKKYEVDESCLSSKIYMGHIHNLYEKNCDYILVPRIENFGKNEKVCVKFNALYDIVKNQFPNINLLNYNIDVTSRKIEFISLLKLGIKLNKNIFKVLYSYFYAKRKEFKDRKIKLNNQIKKLNTNNLKILLVAHPYVINDAYVGKEIIKKLQKLDIEIIDSNIIDRRLAKIFSKKISPTLYWTFSKETLGAIEYYKYSVDGIIFVSTFPCGPDSLVNELAMRKITDLPTTNIIVDEQTSDTGLQTRIESFIDIIKGKKEKNE